MLGVLKDLLFLLSLVPDYRIVQRSKSYKSGK